MYPTYFNDVPETYPSPEHADRPAPTTAAEEGAEASTSITCEVAEASDTTIVSMSFDGWL